ncbi:MAG: EAL domain-containing protein [Sulfurimonas sp.]|uniref:EAL domain-containing response regulator n=1 Tax=Sulfurimonas sp. TaxID=2022749 RepID=UPI00260EEF04|nr:EAL domain-containing protein [Sulfurimonas sp.]MDD2652971.1 EAL domain-containing protein [Sulfurimonas sp.]MDD3452417.1 EAL domain-containing protein [Sulfurimonas sp.]
MNLELVKQIRVFWSSVSVLYIEDEQSIREQVYKMLMKLFDRVDVAVDGEDAFEKYIENDYDLVITDLKMPKMDGIELCQKIVEVNKEQQIILVSAHKEVDEILKLIDIGIAAFLLKPIDMSIMLEKIYLIVKNIYANKMMKYHYEDMKKELLDTSKWNDEDFLYKDTLTSLHNEKYLEKIIDNEHIKLAILVNINDFKLINDYYSFAHGNHLLFQVAELLRKESQKYGYELFRLSKDEFVLLRQEFPFDCDEVLLNVKNMLAVLDKKKYSIIGVKDISVNVTMGIAQGSEYLLENLHRALLHAKRYGLRYACFRDVPDDRENMKNIIEVKELLKNSIEHDSIIPYYQPILTKDKKFKYEVLMRIKNEVDPSAPILPGKFLEIAKNHSFYNEISKMVIFKAIDAMLHNNETFSINFSYQDMKNEPLMQKLQERIAEHNLGERLIFEIIETEHLDNINVVKAFIARFKKYGVKIAIDDFGSGYSNFAHIFLLNPDCIKIDGSLIKDMLDNKFVYIFVETIIDFAHKLGMGVIAEFVSSKEIYDALLELKVDAMQGYFIGYPAPEYLKNLETL